MKRKLFLVGVFTTAAFAWFSKWAQRSAVPGKRLLALGDSYTIGEGVTESDRWPMQLVKRLRHDGVNMAEPFVVAKTGWTTHDLERAIDSAQPGNTYDLVTLLIGVNDQFRGGKADDYRPAFRRLLQRAIGFAAGQASRVTVLSIPDWGVTQTSKSIDVAAIANAIDAFNQVNREESTKLGVHYVDVTEISRQAGPGSPLLAQDGLHPSAEMYAQWVDVLVPVALGALQAKPAVH